jgi:uncharacterized protein YcnI
LNAARLVALTALMSLAIAAPAQAHVTVTPATVAAGSTATLTFRCPNERTAVTTTELTVQMPEAFPFATVVVQPVPGWHAAIATRKLATPIPGPHGMITRAVDTIAWTGGAIAPGAAQTFVIRAGPMPRAASALPFKAIQQYSNGEVVRWIELQNPGDVAPANPAPVVHVH